MKLIDADVLKVEINQALESNHNAKIERIKLLANNGITYDDEFVSIINGKIVALSGVNRFIEEQPAIEAEPVKHGKWVGTSGEDEWYGKVFICNICAKQVLGKYDNYCPNCGAKMEKSK